MNGLRELDNTNKNLVMMPIGLKLRMTLYRWIKNMNSSKNYGHREFSDVIRPNCSFKYSPWL